MRATSSLAAAASAARLAAAAAFRSPPRFAAAPGAGASGDKLHSQPRKLKFGEAATLPTAPAPSHEGRILAPDATLPEVAAPLHARRAAARGRRHLERGPAASAAGAATGRGVPRRYLCYSGKY